MGKRILHDTEMSIEEDTGVLTVRLPGWREDPNRIFSFSPGGSSQGFPVNPARAIVFTEDESEGAIMSASEDSPTGMRATNANIEIQANAPLDEQGRIHLEANGNLLNEQSGVIQLRGNGNPIAEFEVDPAGVSRFGIFSKALTAHEEQSAAIADAVDLASALTSLNALLASQRGYGWIAE